MASVHLTSSSPLTQDHVSTTLLHTGEWAVLETHEAQRSGVHQGQVGASSNKVGRAKHKSSRPPAPRQSENTQVWGEHVQLPGILQLSQTQPYLCG